MTDLTGVELALAVARVVGKHEPRMLVYSNTVVVLTADGISDEWRPDQGGAAAWEVLEWVRRQVNVVAVTIESDGNGGVVCMVAPAMSFDGATIGRGPTDAIALCRAVVALGEAG